MPYSTVQQRVSHAAGDEAAADKGKRGREAAAERDMNDAAGLCFENMRQCP